MLYNETAVKANIRNRDGKRVFYLAHGDQLTSGARDFLSRERIAIVPAEQARPERFRLLSGGFIEVKPEHMTHLNGDVLVDKLHPRIAFRGAVDELEGQLLLCQRDAQGQLKKDLGEVLDFVRELIRCDVLEEPVKREKLCGLTQEQLRQHSHRPQEFYGKPHFMPECQDGEMVLKMNLCRSVARRAELAAVAAFRDREGNPTRVDILQAMNRVSSMLYILMIREK